MQKRMESRIKTVLYTGTGLCLAFLLALAVRFPSLAAKEGQITTDSANVRSEASTDSQRVAQLPKGTAFTVTEETTDAEGRVWYHAVFASGDGQQTGWIRSDLATVTADDPAGEAPQDAPEGEPQAGSGAEINGITVVEPEGAPESAGQFSQTQVMIGDSSFTGYLVDGSLTGQAELYLVYGVDAYGASGWYYYDASQGTIQRDLGQFQSSGKSESEALLEALRLENLDLQEQMESSHRMWMLIAVGAGALALVLLIVVIVLAVKLRRSGYEDDYYEDEDDEDYDDDYEDGYEDGDEEDDESGPEDDEEEESDDEPDEDGAPIWMAALKEKKKQAKEKAKEKAVEAREEEEAGEDPDEQDGGEILAEILQQEEEPAEEPAEEPKPVEKRTKTVKKPEPEKKAGRLVITENDYDDSDDFSVEVIDLDDL